MSTDNEHTWFTVDLEDATGEVTVTGPNAQQWKFKESGSVSDALVEMLQALVNMVQMKPPPKPLPAYNEHKDMPDIGTMIEGQHDGVRFYGRRIFPMDENSPWVVQSMNARGEGPTHEAAVRAWYMEHQRRKPKAPEHVIGHLEYRQDPGKGTWSWYCYGDNNTWLRANGAHVNAKLWPLLGEKLGVNKDGMVTLPVVQAPYDPSRDSLQP